MGAPQGGAYPVVKKKLSPQPEEAQRQRDSSTAYRHSIIPVHDAHPTYDSDDETTVRPFP